LEDKYAGETVLEKFSKIGAKMPKETDHLIITALDDLAWILNLRGSDISFNPIFFAYGMLHKSGDSFSFDLFTEKSKVSEPDVLKHLDSVSTTIHPYSGVIDKIKEIGNKDSKVKISVNTSSCSHLIYG